MKSLCQNVADAVLEVGPQHFHPRHKRKRLSCQSLNFMIIQEKGSEATKLVAIHTLAMTRVMLSRLFAENLFLMDHWKMRAIKIFFMFLWTKRRYGFLGLGPSLLFTVLSLSCQWYLVWILEIFPP